MTHAPRGIKLARKYVTNLPAGDVFTLKQVSNIWYGFEKVDMRVKSFVELMVRKGYAEPVGGMTYQRTNKPFSR